MKPDSCWYKGVCGKSECDEHCIRLLEMNHLVETSGIPKARQDLNKLALIPENCDLEVFRKLNTLKNSIKDVVQKGESVYIYSDYFGNGKTTWSIKILMKYFDQVWSGNGFRTRGLFIHVPSFLNKIKDSMTDPDADFIKMKKQLKSVDLVVWDDIGACKLSDYDHSILLSYIDERVLKNLSNVYTGNLGEAALYKALGGRLFSRVWSSSQVFQLKGSDRRGEHGHITNSK